MQDTEKQVGPRDEMMKSAMDSLLTDIERGVKALLEASGENVPGNLQEDLLRAIKDVLKKNNVGGEVSQEESVDVRDHLLENIPQEQEPVDVRDHLLENLPSAE